MTEESTPDDATSALPGISAEELLSTPPPVMPTPATVSLTIDLGSLTPATVEAIKNFVAAVANDPAKGVGIGPRPGVVWPGTPQTGDGATAGVMGAGKAPKS